MYQTQVGATSATPNGNPTHRTSQSISDGSVRVTTNHYTPSTPPESHNRLSYSTSGPSPPKANGLGPLAGSSWARGKPTTRTRRRLEFFTIRKSLVFTKLRALVLLFLLILGYLSYRQHVGRSFSQSSRLTGGASSGHARDPRRRVRYSEHPFPPSVDPKPVHFLEKNINYANHPLSIHRPPPNQFTLAPDARFDQPVVALIMATNNPRPVLRETATSLFGQSLQNFLWVIVDDHTTKPESLALLSEVAKDPRVVIVRNQGPQGLAQGRNVALKYLLNLDFTPPYFISLDDDDLFEFTALEKTVWLLESNQEWDLGGFPYIKFGAQNETVNTGLHSGWLNFVQGNFVPNAAVYRSSAVRKSGCLYDEENFKTGGEDWDFWMCLAEHGHWGGSIPEPLYWYRMNPMTFRSTRWGSTFIDGFDALKKKVHGKRSSFRSSTDFPTKRPRQSRTLEPITWQAPFDTNLAHHEKSIMFVIPWLYVGGADIGALHMIQLYAEMGYRVTVLCTLYKFPQGVELRPWVLQYTHDVHIMPSFLRAHDFPRYIKYLVDSRGIDNIIMSNSQLMYEMLPAFAEQLPHVKVIDYLHNEAYDGWKSGGYPQYSVIMQRYVARTVTCSEYLKQWLIDRGHDAGRIGVVKLGIEISDFSPVTEVQRAEAKERLLDLEPETLVVSIVGRLDPQKRSTLVPLIVKELLKLGITQDFQFLMLGDGPLKSAVRQSIDTNELDDFVRMLGTVEKPQDFLAATDIFLLPSMSEGISIAVAEAMAMGLPILTARAGALPEQIGDGSSKMGGILVNHTLTEWSDAKLYAKELATLLGQPRLRQRLGANARRLVETTFDWRSTLRGLDKELALSENLGGHGLTHGTPHPAAYLAVQTVLLEAWPESDMLSAYGVYEPTQ
ncbi:UDP-Glycosyltransferase/glycogen phosphorylase [Meredithblackwellia eburnea MCA 4105]